jgi:hypothetical protein
MEHAWRCQQDHRVRALDQLPVKCTDVFEIEDVLAIE